MTVMLSTKDSHDIYLQPWQTPGVEDKVCKVLPNSWQTTRKYPFSLQNCQLFIAQPSEGQDDLTVPISGNLVSCLLCLTKARPAPTLRNAIFCRVRFLSACLHTFANCSFQTPKQDAEKELSRAVSLL